MGEELNEFYKQAKEYIERFPHDEYGLTEPDTRLQLEVLNQKVDLILSIIQVIANSQLDDRANWLKQQIYSKDAIQAFKRYYKSLMRSLEQYGKRRDNE